MAFKGEQLPAVQHKARFDIFLAAAQFWCLFSFCSSKTQFLEVLKKSHTAAFCSLLPESILISLTGSIFWESLQAKHGQIFL